MNRVRKIIHKICNIFLFPIILVLVKIYINSPDRYKTFRKLSFEKMFKWQWKILDRLLETDKFI